MNEQLREFFEQLAERLSKENDISDVLYASLRASKSLRGIFAEMVSLPSAVNQPALFEVWREYTLGPSRPDFLIRPHNGIPVILEVKTFDTNYHYNEYSKI